MEVKALACQLPRDLGLPFSRLTRDEIARQAVNAASRPLSAELRLAMAEPRCHSTLVLPKLDMAPRP